MYTINKIYILVFYIITKYCYVSLRVFRYFTFGITISRYLKQSHK